MTIFGNICVAFIGFGFYWICRFVSQTTSRYDYIIAGLLSLYLLVWFFGLFAAITAQGKFDFLGWPRLLQYGGVALASLSFTVLMGLAAAEHETAQRDYPWSLGPFSPWAAYAVPLLLAIIGFLWLNSARIGCPESTMRAAFGCLLALALYSNIAFGLEVRHHNQLQAEEDARNALLIIQQTDPENDFSRLLMYTSRLERPAARQLALQRVLATGPRLTPLLIDCLRKPVFQDGLTYLRDNDPPGDLAPLAEPARDAILLSAQRLHDESYTGRPLDTKDVESGVDSALTVAGKFAHSGTDFLPAVRTYHAALVDAPKSAKVPSASVRKMDAWLAEKAK